MHRPTPKALLGRITAMILAFGAVSPGTAWSQQEPADPPARWDAAYWRQAQAEAASARAKGLALQAEAWCARWMPYAEWQTVQALREWAAHQDTRQARSGGQARLRAERLARALAERSRAPGAGSQALGFVPDEALRPYAQALLEGGDARRAQAIEDLAQAYRQTQEAYVNRMLRMQRGQDPRGEC